MNEVPPVTQLSDDILRAIFCWYINDDPSVDIPFLPIEEDGYSSSSYWDSDDSDDNYSEPGDSEVSLKSVDNLPPQLIISHVCSAWRRIALSIPRLWNNVCITMFDSQSKRLAEEWLLKAGSSPIFIVIYELDYDDPPFTIYDELREFLSTYFIKSLELTPQSERCPDLPLLLAELPAEKLIYLESLSLVDMETNHRKYLVFDRVESLSLDAVETNRQKYLLLDQVRFPSLRELQLVGRFGDRMTLPWTTLHHLDATGFYMPMMRSLRILRQCTSLEVCILAISSSIPQDSIVEDLYLPALQELTVLFNFDADTGDLIRPLIAPNLKNLTIERVGGFARGDISPLRWSNVEYSRMMERSNTPLRYLEIAHSNEFDPHDVLKSSPILEEARFHKAKFRQDTLNDLAVGRLVPLLQHLRVHQISGVNGSAFSEMIERRNQTSGNIGGANGVLMPFISACIIASEMDGKTFEMIVYPPQQPVTYFRKPESCPGTSVTTCQQCASGVLCT